MIDYHKLLKENGLGELVLYRSFIPFTPIVAKTGGILLFQTVAFALPFVDYKCSEMYLFDSRYGSFTKRIRNGIYKVF